MNAIKDQAFREFGDQGAETLGRYFVQLEYTVLWCIRMLDRMSNIEAVMPEAIEDLVIVRPDLYELHQVKTRSESQGPWAFNDVIGIICQQYHRRKAFLDKRCTFHFVSDGLADNRKSNAKQPDYPASLFQLKHLLEILHDDQPFTVDERCLLDAFQNSLIPKLQQQLVDKHNDAVDGVLMAELLRNTWIETNSCELKRDALNELHFVLVSDHMVDRQYTTHQLHRIHDQILLLVLKKVLGTKSLSERKIIRDDVVKCVAIPNPVREIDLDKLPGETVLEKKTLLGGFDTTEIPNFNRQRKQADWTWRRIGTFGLDCSVSEPVRHIRVKS